jgi:Tfp pilus assembly protein PilV
MRSRLSHSESRRRPAVPRQGLSLLEVLLALGIFLIALTGIGQLISLGSRSAVEARLEAEATLRAESILQELLAGVQPLQATAATAFPDDANWQWTAEVVEGPHVDLVQVTVTVFRQDLDNLDRGAVRLTRLVRDPQLFLDAALQAQ